MNFYNLFIHSLFSAWNVLPTFQFHAPDCSSILESGYTLLSYSFDSTASKSYSSKNSVLDCFFYCIASIYVIRVINTIMTSTIFSVQ